MPAPDMWDLAAVLPGLWASWQDHKKEKGDESSFGRFMGERLPDFLGISKVDESIYARQWMRLDRPQREYLNQLYSEMHDYEVDCLRLVIADMQSPVQKVTKIAATSAKGGPSQPAKEEIVFGDDPRLEFLKALAKEVKTRGAKATVQELRTNRFTIKNPASHRQYLAWLALVKWVKKNILQLFGVKKLKDITPNHFAEQIQKLSALVPPVRDEELTSEFWRPAFKEYPRIMWCSLIITILSAIAIAISH